MSVQVTVILRRDTLAASEVELFDALLAWGNAQLEEKGSTAAAAAAESKDGLSDWEESSAEEESFDEDRETLEFKEKEVRGE